MGRRYYSKIPHFSRVRPVLRFRLALVALLLILFQQQQLYWLYRNALLAKYSPTDFNGFYRAKELLHKVFRNELNDWHLQEELLAKQNEWTMLGSGWEGKTFVFNDSVIKTFVPGRSPFRNCFIDKPGSLINRWPTEIPASLLLGRRIKHKRPRRSVLRSEDNAIESLLPVKTWFMASSDGYSSPEWHLVTALIHGGDLNMLAKETRSKQPENFRKVDALFRPSFNSLLRVLDGLHYDGFCHDDIKPGNIFVENGTRWILGDLGNVRHVSHPYHSSRLWLHDNHQLPDCRANDALRALKTYLQFIRIASNDSEAFDEALVEGKEPLSRLLWWTIQDSSTMTAAELRERSAEVESPQRPPRFYPRLNVGPPAIRYPRFEIFYSRKSIRAHVVEHVLSTRISETFARWNAMTWLFGVPISSC
ncbi:hypothetical protein K469DRAFT_607678 [Zopfia rhizophila CBS 207.26]|uniref:Protein kinase domain-containing protein n=1 Tax=Zopfia rhizophila CBS 207.26 TaxID=1314779 RepID=A0A6A6DB21_9PEZI|nr:hypothetical protein K469DRAFT_607678 [Zopfia rhizophila CBS 207.26]